MESANSLRMHQQNWHETYGTFCLSWSDVCVSQVLGQGEWRRGNRKMRERGRPQSPGGAPDALQLRPGSTGRTAAVLPGPARRHSWEESSVTLSGLLICVIQTGCLCSPSVFHSVWPHGLQHARLPCPSPPPGACSDACPSSWRRHPPSHPLSPLLPPSTFQSIRVFSSESALRIRWPKEWMLPLKH